MTTINTSSFSATHKRQVLRWHNEKVVHRPLKGLDLLPSSYLPLIVSSLSVFELVEKSLLFISVDPVPDPLKGTKSTGLRPRASGGLAPQGALTGLLCF